MSEKKPLILVVDDEPDVVQLVKRVLELEGYEVITTADGDQALALVSERNPELVLLDIKMPGKSGIEVLEELRAHHEDMAVIMASGIGEMKKRNRSNRAKPCTSLALWRSIKNSQGNQSMFATNAKARASATRMLSGPWIMSSRMRERPSRKV